MSPAFSSDFNQIWISSTHTHKSFQYQVSRNSEHCEPCSLMRTARQTNMTKQMGDFRDYA